MKYVVIELTTGKNDVQREMPFIFPDAVVHSDFYHMISSLFYITHPNACNIRAVAAGFVNSTDLAVTCHGESETLGLKSRSIDDAKLMLIMDYTHGIVL